MFGRRIQIFLPLGLFSAGLVATLPGCSSSDDGVAVADDDLMVNRVRDPIAIDLDTPVNGKFVNTKRVYGYTFEAKAGATIQVTLETKAGTRASAAAGSKLDTVVEIYGPIEGKTFGSKLAATEDGPGGSEEALPPAVKLDRDGKYLIVFSTWDETGADSTFTLKAACSGTEFQCKKPLPAGACEPGTKYVRAADPIGTETWKACEVVLLETVTVPENDVLTVAAGVTVKGNYLGAGAYGDVQLVVNGKLQAVGTADKPVTFTALQSGWKGLVLNGQSNTLENAFVEKAEVGLTLNGPNNTIKKASVNSGGLGILIGPRSTGNTVAFLRVTKNDNGISFQPGGQGAVEDSVITGNGTGQGIGIASLSKEVSQFRRTYVSNFQTGLSLVDSALEVIDATITKNAGGIYVSGDGAGRYAPGCPDLNVPPPPPPAPPTTWRSYDPSFIRSDITDNTSYGIKIDAPELLVVEECNITGNGFGILNEAVSLHPESRIIKSNIHGNGPSDLQVESYHLNGTLNISGNYWARISDPQLSASWNMKHELSQTCSMSVTTRWQGDGFSNGIYRCTYAGVGSYQYNCSGTATAMQSGTFTFTNFAPEKLAAGPKVDTLCDAVITARTAAQ